MISSISDIPKLLNIIGLYDGQKSATRNNIKKIFKNEPIRLAKLPNYDKLEKLCTLLNLIVVKQNNISLTNPGRNILKQYKNNIFDEKLKETFVREIVFKSNLGNKIRNDFTKFQLGVNRSLWYPKDKIYDMFEIPEILPMLYELGVLEKNDDRVEITAKYSKLFDTEQRKITQKQLECQLQNQRTIGDIGEEIVLDFEKSRLQQIRADKSIKIKRISKEHANAGYDIESFFMDENKKIHKMYIEVKGTSGKEFDFYWSANELKKAKEYGEKYWIYFVAEIDVKTRQSLQKPIRIQNPYKTIFEESSFKKEIEKYHITKTD